MVCSGTISLAGGNRGNYSDSRYAVSHYSRVIYFFAFGGRIHGRVQFVGVLYGQPYLAIWDAVVNRYCSRSFLKLVCHQAVFEGVISNRLNRYRRLI